MTFTPDEMQALIQNPLFEGLKSTQLDAELKFYKAEKKSYVKGDTLLKTGFPVERFAVILSGSVQVMSDDINGHHMIMITVQPSQSFGESLCFQREMESPVYAAALSPTSVLWLSADGLRKGHEARFINMLTAKTLSMNDRVQALSKLTLRDKLFTLFSQYALQYGPSFTLPFDRESLAAYLGANRSALSRVLGEMKREGLIDISKNRVTLNIEN